MIEKSAGEEVMARFVNTENDPREFSEEEEETEVYVVSDNGGE